MNLSESSSDFDRMMLVNTGIRTGQTGALQRQIVMSLMEQHMIARQDILDRNRIITTGMTGNMPFPLSRTPYVD